MLGIITQDIKFALCFPRPCIQCPFPAPHSISPPSPPYLPDALCFSRSQPWTLSPQPTGFPERLQVGCQYPEDSKAAQSLKACQGQISTCNVDQESHSRTKEPQRPELTQN